MINRAKLKGLLINPYSLIGLLSTLIFSAYLLSHLDYKVTTKTTVTYPLETSNTSNKMIIDPDDIYYMDLKENTKHSTQNRVISNFQADQSKLFFFSALYAITLTLLVTFYLLQKHSKQKIQKELNNYKNISADMWMDIEKYKNILEPELNINALKMQLTEHSDSCIADGVIVVTRKVLEKVLAPIFKEAFPSFSEETTLNNIIYNLNKKQTITRAAHNYARTIQSFGNMAAHSSANSTSTYGPKEAESVLNSLLLLLKELDSSNLLKS